MLKLLSVLILVACAQSAIIEAKETTLEVPTWENLIKCLNEVKPLFPHIKNRFILLRLEISRQPLLNSN